MFRLWRFKDTIVMMQSRLNFSWYTSIKLFSPWSSMCSAVPIRFRTIPLVSTWQAEKPEFRVKEEWDTAEYLFPDLFGLQIDEQVLTLVPVLHLKQSHRVVKMLSFGTKNDPVWKKGGGTHLNAGGKLGRKEMSAYSHGNFANTTRVNLGHRQPFLISEIPD